MNVAPPSGMPVIPHRCRPSQNPERSDSRTPWLPRRARVSARSRGRGSRLPSRARSPGLRPGRCVPRQGPCSARRGRASRNPPVPPRPPPSASRQDRSDPRPEPRLASSGTSSASRRSVCARRPPRPPRTARKNRSSPALIRQDRHSRRACPTGTTASPQPTAGVPTPGSSRAPRRRGAGGTRPPPPSVWLARRRRSREHPRIDRERRGRERAPAPHAKVRRLLRISVMRFTGTPIRRASSNAFIPSASRPDGWIGAVGLCQVNRIQSEISVNYRWLLYAMSMA